MKNYYPELDALRFAAAMLVMLSHVERMFSMRGLEGFFSDSLIFESGKAGVSIFFALSGFLLGKIAFEEKQQSGALNLKNFYRRRALRILPLYYVMTAVVFFVLPNFSAFYFEGETEELRSFFVQKFALFALALPNLNVFLFNESVPAAGQFWTIGIEVIFYLILPLIVLSKKPLRWMLGIIGSYYVLRYGIPQLGKLQNFENLAAQTSRLIFFNRIDCLVLGAATAFLASSSNKYVIGLSVRDNVIFGTGLMALMLIFHRRLINGFDYFIYSAAILPLLLNITSKASNVSISWWLKALAFGGKISYSIYLTHLMVIAFVFHLVYNFTTLTGNMLLVVNYVASVITVIAFSTITYKFIEEPFLKAKRTAMKNEDS